jgi:hypothetical protein
MKRRIMQETTTRETIARHLGVEPEAIRLVGAEDGSLSCDIDFRAGLRFFGATGRPKAAVMRWLREQGVQAFGLHLPFVADQRIRELMEADDRIHPDALVLLEGAKVVVEISCSEAHYSDLVRLVTGVLEGEGFPADSVSCRRRRDEEVPELLVLRVLQGQQPATLPSVVDALSKQGFAFPSEQVSVALHGLQRSGCVVCEPPSETSTHETFSLTLRGHFALPHVRKRRSPDLQRLLDLNRPLGYSRS